MLSSHGGPSKVMSSRIITAGIKSRIELTCTTYYIQFFSFSSDKCAFSLQASLQSEGLTSYSPKYLVSCYFVPSLTQHAGQVMCYYHISMLHYGAYICITIHHNNYSMTTVLLSVHNKDCQSVRSFCACSIINWTRNHFQAVIPCRFPPLAHSLVKIEQVLHHPTCSWCLFRSTLDGYYKAVSRVFHQAVVLLSICQHRQG